MSSPNPVEAERALPSILNTITKERDEIKRQIQSLSGKASPDVDEWIIQAKQLQADIERSRQTARSIVQEAEAANRLLAATQDASTKADLLRKELDYNETLAATIDSIQVIAGQLDAAQDAIASEELVQGLEKLEIAEQTLSRLDPFRNMRSSIILQKRYCQMTELLTSKAQDCWNQAVLVCPRYRRLSISPSSNESIPEISDLADLMSRLGVLQKVISRLHSDLDRIIINPCFSRAADGALSGMEVTGNTIQICGRHENPRAAEVVEDNRRILDFLKQHLPERVIDMLFEQMLPSLALQLIDGWLNPLVPVNLDELAKFGDTVSKISDLASYIERFKVTLPSEADLNSWIEQLPATWMARRRESALSQLRRRCYHAIRTKRTVERRETQTVAHDDALAAGSSQEDEWSDDWDDENEEEDAEKPAGPTGQAPRQEEQSLPPEQDSSQDESEEGGEEDAWGWGDEEGEDEPVEQKPKSTKREDTHPKPNGAPKKVEPKLREVTLRETYTVTEIPATILDLISQCLSDAAKLVSPEYPIREVSAAAPALSSIPTLLLAFYRAIATTIYAADPAANMLIYNDAQYLISALEDLTKSLDPSHPLSKRLRLDNDIKQLTSYAKRAYGREMDSQRTILRDLLSSASGFINASAPINAREYTKAVDDAVHRIRDVDRLWQPVLSSSARLQSIGSLLSTVTTKMAADILELADDPAGISEEQSKVLKGFCDQVAAVADLFDQRDAGAGEARSLVHVYSPEWLRFVYLGEILEASLADIKYLWTEGELSLEFEESEVVELIKALFADSEYRRNALKDIRNSGKGAQQ